MRVNPSLGELRRDKEKLSTPISCELRRVKENAQPNVEVTRVKTICFSNIHIKMPCNLCMSYVHIPNSPRVAQLQKKIQRKN